MACILTLRMEKPNHTKKYGDIVQVHQHEWWYSSGSSTWIQFSILRFCKTSGNLRISLTLCYKHQNRSTRIHWKCNVQTFLYCQNGPYAQKVAYLCCWSTGCTAGRWKGSVSHWRRRRRLFLLLLLLLLLFGWRAPPRYL